MNITKLKIWPELQSLGFEKITFRSNGKIVATGAALRKELTSITGEKFHTDIICIEPASFLYTDKKYHITGDYKTPFTGKFYRYEGNSKVELFEQVTRENNYHTANNILPTIKKMMS